MANNSKRLKSLDILRGITVQVCCLSTTPAAGATCMRHLAMPNG